MKTKRILALALSLCMIFTMLPTFTLTASATTTATESGGVLTIGGEGEYSGDHSWGDYDEVIIGAGITSLSEMMFYSAYIGKLTLNGTTIKGINEAFNWCSIESVEVYCKWTGGNTIAGVTVTNRCANGCVCPQEGVCQHELIKYTQKNGKHTGVCNSCEDTIVTDEQCSGGKATCTEPAICKTCNNEYEPALGHITESGCMVAQICNRAGCGVIFAPAPGHTWVGDSCDLCGVGLRTRYANYFEISTADDLYEFATQVNDGDLALNAVLMADIVVNENLLTDILTIDNDGTATVNSGKTVKEWDSIGKYETYNKKPYQGHFFGNGFSISGLYDVSSADGSTNGLFGYTYGATIEDVTIIDSYFSGNVVGSVVNLATAGTTVKDCTFDGIVNVLAASGAYVGGVVGRASVSNENETVTISNCTNNGDIYNYGNGDNVQAVGGIVGVARFSIADNLIITVSGCTNYGEIKCDSNGSPAIAGIVGKAALNPNYNNANATSKLTISECGNFGNIQGDAGIIAHTGSAGGGITTSIESCYNGGTINGLYHSAAGIAAYFNSGQIIKSYNYGAVTAEHYAAGIVASASAGVPRTVNIENCYNVGTINATGDGTTLSEGKAGGVAAYTFGDVTIGSCYNIGTINGNETYPITFTGDVESCYYLDSCVTTASGQGTARTQEQMVSDENWTTNYSGFDTSVWSKDNNTTARLYYPKLGSYSPYISLHDHLFTYKLTTTTTENDTIEATCANCDANEGTDYVVSVILKAPESLTYKGEAIAATVSENNLGVTAESIKYEKSTGTDAWEEITSAPVNAGTYRSSISLGEGDNEKTAYVTYSITAASISDATVTVADGEHIYDGEEHKPNVTVTLGGKTLTENDYDVKYSNNIGYGEAIVTVTGKGNYKDSATGKFNIGQSASTLTAAADKESYTYGEDVKITVSGIKATGTAPAALFALTSQVTSDNTVAIYEGETQLTEPQTVSGSNLVFTVSSLTVGEHTLTAKFSGDGNMAGVEKNVTVNVSAATLTNVSVSQSGTLTYSGSGQSAEVTTAATAVNDVTVTFTYSAEENGTYTSDVPEFTDVDDYTVYYKATAANHNEYKGSFKITISKATAEVKTHPQANELEYNSEPQALVTSGEALTGNGIVYSLEKEGTYTSTIPTGEDATNYTVWYKAEGDNNYNDSKPQSVTVEIAKKEITATLTVTTKPYDNKTNATVTVTLPVFDGDDVSVTGITGTFNNANAETNKTVIIDSTSKVISGADKDNYNITIPTTATGTITKADAPVITFPTASAITYGQTLANAALSFTSNDYGTFAWADSTVKPEAGTTSYKVTFTASADAKANYDIEDSEKDVSITINPAKVNAPNAIETPFTYNGGKQTYAIAENVLYTIDGNERTDAGSQNVTVALKDKKNYTWDNGSTEDLTFTFTIAPLDIKDAEITLGEALTYDGTVKTQTVTSVKVDGLDVTYDVSDNKQKDHKADGNYTLTVTGKGNFTGTATQAWNIAKKDITRATVGAFAGMTYTGNAQTPAATVTIDGLEATGTWSDVTNVADPTTFTASGNFMGTIADKATNMQKGKAAITVDTTPIVKTYGDTWELPTAISNFDTATADKSVSDMVNANTYTVTYTVVGTDNYDGDTKEISVTINPKKIDKPVADETAFVYSESEQTYTVAENAAYIVGNNKRTNEGSQTVTVELNDKVNYTWNDGSTEDLTFTFTIAKKSIADATVALTEELTFDGNERTQNVTVSLDGFTVTFDVTDNKATNVNTEGNYTLKVTANGNFEGEKTLEWNIKPATPTANTEKVTTARVRRNKTLADATVTNGEFFAVDGTTPLEGTFTWVDDTAETISEDTTKKMKFTPTDTNYAEIEIDVAVDSYTSGGGGSSSTSTSTTKNDDGSTTKTTTNKTTGTVTETTTNPDGSTTTVETKKDGTVTTTEKDKDGNTTTTVENPDGTSTTTEKTTDGTTTVTEKDADGTTTTTETDKAGNKTVTTENTDGSTVTEETKKDGTKVVTETNSDGETSATVETKKETEVTIPVENADEVTKVVVTDENGVETEAEFTVTDGGVAITVDGNVAVSVQTGHICYAKDFTDVDLAAWYHENVCYVLGEGLMKGTATDKFAPNDNLTRAMLVTILYRAEGEPATNKSIPFSDVDMGSWYASAVIWAQQNGIVKGVSETEFAPNDNITREQIAAILYRYAIYKGMNAVNLSENLGFADADEISEYAISAMNWAVGNGLIKGYENNTVRPLNNATRAEAAALLQRFLVNNK